MPRQNVSVIIPCYNEADSIGRCLEALANQSVKPLEIIIVDNNCTDNTVELAKTFARVKIIKETKQGIIAARDAGMATARGNILARIDADTFVAPDWIAQIQNLFVDDDIQAITGTGFFYDLPLKRISRGARNVVAIGLNRLILGHDMLWGSNMAIRRQAWRVIDRELCRQPNIMEDLDMAMHVAANFGPSALRYDNQMRADISARRATTGLVKNFLYLKMWPATLRNHHTWRPHLLWPAVGFLAFAAFPVIKYSNRFYDVGRQRMVFSRAQWRKRQYDRPNP